MRYLEYAGLVVLAGLGYMLARASRDASWAEASMWERFLLRYVYRLRGKTNGYGDTIRRAFPIHAYVGANGSGKTLAAVHDCLPTLAGVQWQCENAEHGHDLDGSRYIGRSRNLDPRTGQPLAIWTGWRYVLSTALLLDDRGRPHPRYVPFTDYRQLIGAYHCDVLMDEVTGVASARQSQSLPAQVENLLVQLRRRDVILRWTSPSWARADRVIRECSQAVTYCRGFRARRVAGRLWADRRLFKWSTFDARDFDEFTLSKRDKIAPECKQWYWRPGGDAMRAYSTLAPVSSLGVATEGGMCLHCGGRRSMPRCSCDAATVDALDPTDVEIVEERDARGTRRRSARSRAAARTDDAATAPARSPALVPGDGVQLLAVGAVQ